MVLCEWTKMITLLDIFFCIFACSFATFFLSFVLFFLFTPFIGIYLYSEHYAAQMPALLWYVASHTNFYMASSFCWIHFIKIVWRAPCHDTHDGVEGKNILFSISTFFLFFPRFFMVLFSVCENVWTRQYGKLRAMFTVFYTQLHNTHIQ